MDHDMETIQNMQGLPGDLGDHAKVRLPHVAADEPEPCGALLAELLEELPKGLMGALSADPQQSPATGIELVDEGQIFMPFFPGDLVDTDGGNM